MEIHRKGRMAGDIEKVDGAEKQILERNLIT